MKTKPAKIAAIVPTEDDIRRYAEHLYVQSGRIPGHDQDNWLEAKACLEANIPKDRSHARLHHHRHPRSLDAFTVIALETIKTDETGVPLVESEYSLGSLGTPDERRPHRSRRLRSAS